MVINPPRITHHKKNAIKSKFQLKCKLKNWSAEKNSKATILSVCQAGPIL
jgi:hypothetical protein